jgi:ribosomal protein S12 methylthiotransferase
MTQRAEERLGETVEVLVEAITGEPLDRTAEGRAAHQAPEVDGATVVTGAPVDVQVGDLIRASVTGSAGVDLTARYLDTADAVARPVVTAGR